MLVDFRLEWAKTMNSRLLLWGGALLLAVAGGVVWWGSQGKMSPQTLEPAAGQGTAASGEEVPSPPGPSKAHNGKVLSGEPSIPTVTIAGQTVITRKMLYNQELEAATPASLKGEAGRDMLSRRVTVGGYSHNPSVGPLEGPLQVIEMTDLACVPCLETSKVLDTLMEKYAGKMRLTNIHAPMNRFNDVNMPAFYGKVAQRGGKFWEYRKALQNLQNPTPDTYFETLIDVGMDRLEARRLLQTESRRFYRELDADAQLAEQLHVGTPPHVFVNGIHVGVNAIPLEKLADVVFYDMTRPKGALEGGTGVVP